VTSSIHPFILFINEQYHSSSRLKIRNKLFAPWKCRSSTVRRMPACASSWFIDYIYIYGCNYQVIISLLVAHILTILLTILISIGNDQQLNILCWSSYNMYYWYVSSIDDLYLILQLISLDHSSIYVVALFLLYVTCN
jgi:hypothetical protein